MRKLAAVACGFSAAVFWGQYLLIREHQLPAAAVLLLVTLLARMTLSGRRRLRLTLICGGLAAGLVYNWAWVTLVQLPAEGLAGEERLAELTILEYPQPTEYGARAAVRLEGENIRCMYYGAEGILELEPGNRLSGSVRLSSASNINGDKINSFTSKGIFLLAYGEEMTVKAGSASSPRWWPARVGDAMQAQIADCFPGDEGAFLAALLTGERGGLSEERCTQLTQAGMLHILAVSGMHCGFLLAALELLLGRHRRRLTAAAGIPLLAFYALLTGCSPSVVRSCIMLGFLLLAPLFRRDSDSPTALSAALAVILLSNPFAAASVSLQLSFGAVAGLLWLAPKLYSILAGKGKNPVRRFLAAGFSASAGALVFTAPVSAVYFGSLVLAAPLSNLLCLPAVGPAFALGLAVVLAGFVFPPLGSLLGVIPVLLIRYILLVAEWIAGLRYHAVYFTNPYLKYWLLMAYALLFLAWRLKGKKLRFAAVGAAALSLCFTVYWGAERDSGALLNITVLDVGQGQCVLAEAGETCILIDCGSANSWYSPGDIAADALHSAGCHELDHLVLTHYDTDHISGLPALLDRMTVKTIIAPDTEDEDGLWAGVSQEAEDHGVELTRTLAQVLRYPLEQGELVIWPPVGEKGDNELGLTVLVGNGGQELLVTGDMNRDTERRLMQKMDMPDIEVLLAGHHGSADSTSMELLYVTTPEQVIISVGKNAYGHPDPEVLGRLERFGAQVRRTDLEGTIHISLN